MVKLEASIPSSADKEFVWSLWKRLQLSNPDLTQAVSLVVQREKQKAEVKDRKVLEILQAKDSKIETLEQRLSGQQQEINDLIQRKIAVDEENARLKNEFSNLNQKFKDKSEELKDTEECAQKKEEQNRLVIKNLEEENKGLNTRCADLLNDLEKLRKQEVQWKTEKSGSDARIKVRSGMDLWIEQMKELNSKCSNLSSQLAVKQEELSQKECDMTRTKKELQELQNLYRQNITHTAQQAELIQQLQALNTDTQKVLKDQEDAHTAETTSYQKLYNELTLCFETVKTSEIQLQQNCASLQEQLFGKDQKICQLQQQLQQAHDALNVLYQDSSHELQVFQQPSLGELECLITMQKSEIELLQEKLKKTSLSLAEHNLYTTETLENNNVRTGRKHKEPPVKRSRSLSPKSSFRKSEELRKLKIAERKIENLEKTLQLKTQETDELRAAYEKRKERLQMLQTNYRALKEQLKQWEEGDSRYQCADPRQLFQEDSDAVWNELAFFKQEHKKLLIEKLNLEEELDQMKVHQSMGKFRIQEFNYVCNKKQVQQLERRCKTIEGELKKLKEVNKDLLKEKNDLKSSLKVQKEDADTRERELEKLLKQICEMKRDNTELQAVIDEQEKEATCLKRQVAEANRLRKENEDLLSQTQELKCLLGEAKAVATSGQCNCKITGTKVKLKTAKKKSSLGHHGAFLKQSIKVMSNVFENFCKDGWEDVSEKGTLCICKALNRTKRRNSIFQKPGYSAALLRERIKSLQQQIAVLQSEKKTAVSSVKGFKEVNEKLTTQLHLADQRLQTNKLTIQVLTSNLAKWQQEKEDLQGKLKLREHLSQTAGKSEATPAPSKNIDLEMKQMQCKLKVTEQIIWSIFSNSDMQCNFFPFRISRLERDLNMKRHLIEDLRSRLRAYQENEKACNETLDSLERKLKSLNEDCSNKKASIDSLKQRLNVATKEKSHYEQMYHKTKDELEKKDVKLSNLESKMSETERAMTELETAASQQLHGLAKQSGQALETIQKKLLFANERVEEFMTFVKALSTELQHSIQELRIKIKQAKKKEEARACKKGLSQESILLAASILNVSTTDVEEILEVEDDEETAKTQMESEKDKEWLHKIQKLLEAQFPFATYLMDAILEKLNEKKKLVEEYSSLMKRIA
uniref:Centlein n=1 Tax=Anas zonorhyncha TaxID=75864 RepID=A0A8B9UJI2_9AVES